jgi:hypothetical protein
MRFTTPWLALAMLLGVPLTSSVSAGPVLELSADAYFTVREFPDGTRLLHEGGTLPTFRGFISNVLSFQDRTMMEFDLRALPSRFDSATLNFMTTGGTVVPRTVGVGWYEADGLAANDDFDVPVTPFATFSQPAAVVELVEIDVSDLLSGVGRQFEYIGFRFEMQTMRAQTFLSSEPASVVLVSSPSTLALGCVGVLLVLGRQCRKKESRKNGVTEEGDTRKRGTGLVFCALRKPA